MPPIRLYRELVTASTEDLLETLHAAGGDPNMFLGPMPIHAELARRATALQTAELARLTRHIRDLTIVLAVVAGASLLAAVIAAWAAIVLLQRPA